MKKVLFLFMLIGAAAQLKAQTKFELQPFNKLPDDFYKKYKFTFPDSLTRFSPQIPNRAMPQRIDSNKPDFSKQYAYNPMPIVRTVGRSNMPIVKTQGNSRMPIINPDAGIISFIQQALP
jgi:hypothetical protein